MKEIKNYIAHQKTNSGLDEIQNIVINWHLKNPTALSGPPGTGKTELVHKIAEALEQTLYEENCDKFTTPYDLIGHPELRANGSSHTEWINGVVADAISNEGILYLDEFDQLPGSVQKKFNSVYDQRRKVRRGDGKEFSSESDFWGVVSYNPSDSLAKRELEESIADRFVHMAFDYMPADLEAAIALKDFSKVKLQERAITLKPKPNFLVKENGSWKTYFTDSKTELPENSIVYQAFTGDYNNEFNENELNEFDPKTKMIHKLAYFIKQVRTFAKDGTTKLEEEVKKYLSDAGAVVSVRLHTPSVRILKATAEEYNTLTEAGCPYETAQRKAVDTCIEQICYGKFGQQKLNTITSRQAVETIAEFYGLIPRKQQRSTL